MSFCHKDREADSWELGGEVTQLLKKPFSLVIPLNTMSNMPLTQLSGSYFIINHLDFSLTILLLDSWKDSLIRSTSKTIIYFTPGKRQNDQELGVMSITQGPQTR